MRLGFAVKVLGRPELKSHDTRRWQSSPHLKVSLGYLRAILRYLQETGIHMYRMSSDLAPYLTHPGMPQFHNQLEESRADLAAVGAIARALDIRLSVHPAQYIVLNSENEDVARKAALDLAAQARLLDLMGQGPEAVVVVHGGSGAGGMAEATARFVQRFNELPQEARARLVVENDESVFAVRDTLRIHEACGVRLVLDLLHHHLHNPERQPAVAALEAALGTWPAGEIPKIHVSSPRTEMHVDERKDPASGKKVPVVRPPQWSQHSDFANPFEVIAFLEEVRAARLRPFDIMLELKSKDVGLVRLREDFGRYAPELAGVWQ